MLFIGVSAIYKFHRNSLENFKENSMNLSSLLVEQIDDEFLTLSSMIDNVTSMNKFDGLEENTFKIQQNLGL